ncbi:MAG: hypothetical protein A2677_00200 [Candidatus Komeilibacteria bacterium RIFCSPHIGHO2_01_FULL_52_14]|uniref:Uncharacterized protein n=1 Tax=Candidatus Komeilibacteria bacterium RIFCSPHIGHO2_01_FULL_52_14 TaxID=1798549 RepID=A0A1G2BIN4_9BACT|nr:MAG: hypothetical protein A2677_00200 [Candidatus Komeilibacteria bacterium RIFCSPHIGHO2_01_FULL_52_14]
MAQQSAVQTEQQDRKQYEPIFIGGSRVVGTMGIVLLAVLNILFLPGFRENTMFAQVWFILFLWLSLCCLLTTPLFITHDWLNRYFRQNIIGFNKVHYLDDALMIGSKIVPRNAKPEGWLFAISIPLGGWFNRPRIFRGPVEAAGWSVKVAYRPFSEDQILLADPQGNQLALPMRDILSLAQRQARELISPPSDLDMGVAFLLGRLNAREAELRERAQDTAVLELTVRVLGYGIARTIHELDHSRRFVKSKEGMLIRRRLMQFAAQQVAEHPWLVGTAPDLKSYVFEKSYIP